MTSATNQPYRLLAIVPFALLLSACTAGDAQFTPQTPAGFWWGLWHGVISVVSLIVHLFSDSVRVYEAHNSGGWYDFGFLLGVIIVWGGGCHAKCRSAERRQRDKEWEEIGDKVERKVMRRLKTWAEKDEGDSPDEEWDEISDKVEKKLKRKLREWADKD